MTFYQRAESQSVRDAVTAIEKRIAILDIEDDGIRVQEAWASQFCCPNCGRCSWGMVDTKKNCIRCGEGLLRRDNLVTEAEARKSFKKGSS